MKVGKLFNYRVLMRTDENRVRAAVTPQAELSRRFFSLRRQIGVCVGPGRTGRAGPGTVNINGEAALKRPRCSAALGMGREPPVPTRSGLFAEVCLNERRNEELRHER